MPPFEPQMPPQGDPQVQQSPVQQPSVFSPQEPIAPPPPTGTPSIHQVKQTKLMLVGVGSIAVILLITTLVFASKASTTAAALQAKYEAGNAAGKASQKKTDAIAYNKELTADFRTYEAPTTSGSFRVNYPKNWSLSIDSTTSDPTLGLVNPEYVNQKSTIGYALSFNLKDTAYAATKKLYDDQVKFSKGKLKVEAITVSGIKGFKYTGILDPNNQKVSKPGTVVVLPLRDKTMLLQTDNNELYATVYNRMLDEIVLIP